MLAQINPWVIYSWFGSLVVADLVALVAIIGCFAARRRRTWLAVIAILAIVLGTWVAWTTIAHMPGIAESVIFLSVAPPILGIISLIHWIFFTREHTSP